MQTNAPAGGEWVDQYNRAIAFGQINVDQLANLPAHASTHATGGSDAITPASIGAVRFLNATVDLNYASIAGFGGFADSNAITVTGAELNDLTLVNCVSIRGSGDSSRPLLFSAFVSATDAVTVRAVNPTAVVINPNSYTFKILVAKGI
jgi:hypothetical protein